MLCLQIYNVIGGALHRRERCAFAIYASPSSCGLLGKCRELTALCLERTSSGGVSDLCKMRCQIAPALAVGNLNDCSPGGFLLGFETNTLGRRFEMERRRSLRVIKMLPLRRVGADAASPIDTSGTGNATTIDRLAGDVVDRRLCSCSSR